MRAAGCSDAKGNVAGLNGSKILYEIGSLQAVGCGGNLVVLAAEQIGALESDRPASGLTGFADQDIKALNHTGSGNVVFAVHVVETKPVKGIGFVKLDLEAGIVLRIGRTGVAHNVILGCGAVKIGRGVTFLGCQMAVGRGIVLVVFPVAVEHILDDVVIVLVQPEITNKFAVVNGHDGFSLSGGGGDDCHGENQGDQHKNRNRFLHGVTPLQDKMMGCLHPIRQKVAKEQLSSYILAEKLFYVNI